VHRFRELFDRSRDIDEPDRRIELLTEALGLWRGVALADVFDDEERARYFRSWTSCG
jgi:hypothetical protein